MTHWSVYTEGRHDHTVGGDLRVAHQVYSPQLGNSRDILVYLPPSYWHSQRRYPVLYMQDGQNLFDAHTSYAGEWGVDKTLDHLAREGIEAIAVGIPNTGESRLAEYNPYVGGHFKPARGDAYIHFIMDTLKPMIDNDFRTLRDSRHTGIVGSSMGGLISLYGYLAYPWTFGLCIAMSPSLWIARSAVLDHVRHMGKRGGRVYIDVGTREVPGRSKHSAATSDSVSVLYSELQDAGYRADDSVKFVREKGGEHNEAAWGRRLPDALRFILRGEH
jgi:predicted alpha/beta superfamily hydrolase